MKFLIPLLLIPSLAYGQAMMPVDCAEYKEMVKKITEYGEQKVLQYRSDKGEGLKTEIFQGEDSHTILHVFDNGVACIIDFSKKRDGI
jgi:hypothetical protein